MMPIAKQRSAHHTPRLGAFPTDEGTYFALWSTRASSASVRLYTSETEAGETIPLAAREGGLFDGLVRGARAGALYKFVVDATELPDPYARFLPYGVHGPARVEPESQGVSKLESVPPRGRLVVYEIHVGTFTPEGTYRAATEKLPLLAELGITAIELMPIAAFDGKRGWGYDGVALFAPYAPYGEPEDLRRFLSAAHRLGIAVVLDVVYNHFGPAGNYLQAYSREYFTDQTKTAWGDAPDFGQPFLRAMITENARYWLEEIGFDGLRLDATHGIVDDKSPHVLAEIASLAHAMDPPRLVFAEDERNEPALVRQYGLDGVWADDFHHVLRVTLTGEDEGYFAAYHGGAEELARVIDRGWLYEGAIYAPSHKPRGKPASGLPSPSFVYCIQNHDQIGNRALGERMAQDVSTDAYRAATMLLLFLPATPLLFMGQEWGASTPFLYFTDHEADLGAAITEGRRDEFKGFRAFSDPANHHRVPDPQSVRTFESSRLDWSERTTGEHARILETYRFLLTLRRSDPVLAEPDRERLRAEARGDLLVVRRWSDRAQEGERALVLNTAKEPRPLPGDLASFALRHRSFDGPFDGTLPPHCALLLSSVDSLTP